VKNVGAGFLSPWTSKVNKLLTVTYLRAQLRTFVKSAREAGQWLHREPPNREGNDPKEAENKGNVKKSYRAYKKEENRKGYRRRGYRSEAKNTNLIEDASINLSPPEMFMHQTST